MESARDRIMARAKATPMEVSRAVVDYFRDHPEVSAVYEFYNGDIVDEKVMQSQCRTRLGALVSIGTRGIPVHISRWAVENRPLIIK